MRLKFLLNICSFVGIVFLISFFCGRPVLVSAHQSQTNNSITAILHIDPNDDPIAGELSHIIIIYEDEQKQLDLKKCDCEVIISSGTTSINKNLFDQDVAISNLLLSFPYTFEKPGIYTISISGKPTNQSQFKPFHMSYDIRVEQQQTSQVNPSISSHVHEAGAAGIRVHFLHYILIGGTILFGLGLIVYDKIKYRK